MDEFDVWVEIGDDDTILMYPMGFFAEFNVFHLILQSERKKFLEILNSEAPYRVQGRWDVHMENREYRIFLEKLVEIYEKRLVAICETAIPTDALEFGFDKGYSKRGDYE